MESCEHDSDRVHECRLTDINTSCCAGKTTPVSCWCIQKHELWPVAASCFRNSIFGQREQPRGTCTLQHRHTPFHPPHHHNSTTLSWLGHCKRPSGSKKKQKRKNDLYSLEEDWQQNTEESSLQDTHTLDPWMKQLKSFQTKTKAPTRNNVDLQSRCQTPPPPHPMSCGCWTQTADCKTHVVPAEAPGGLEVGTMEGSRGGGERRRTEEMQSRWE